MREKTVAGVPKLAGIAVTFGADFEGELRGDDGLVVASDVFASMRGDKVERFGFVGCDGNDAIMEMRPAPSTSAFRIISNISHLLRHVYGKGLSVSVAGHQLPVGAHIHFGVPQQAVGTAEMARVVEVLDDFLGRRLQGLSGRERMKHGYGDLSDWRRNGHGFEYRTLPACIYRNPGVLRVVYHVAKRVFERLATGDFTYQTDRNGATGAELARLVGRNKADRLENFIRQYGQMRQEKHMVGIDETGWERVM